VPPVEGVEKHSIKVKHPPQLTVINLLFVRCGLGDYSFEQNKNRTDNKNKHLSLRVNLVSCLVEKALPKNSFVCSNTSQKLISQAVRAM
jgi:hypothetical protein